MAVVRRVTAKHSVALLEAYDGSVEQQERSPPWRIAADTPPRVSKCRKSCPEVRLVDLFAASSSSDPSRERATSPRDCHSNRGDQWAAKAPTSVGGRDTHSVEPLRHSRQGVAETRISRHTQDRIDQAAAAPQNASTDEAGNVAHHLSSVTAYAIYEFLNGPDIRQVSASELKKMGAEQSQQSVGTFAKKRHRIMWR